MWLTLKRFQQPLALLTIIFALGVHHGIKNYTSNPVSDGYAKYAYSIKTWGVYGLATSTTEPPASDMGRAPLYPLFLAGMLSISPTYEKMVKSWINGEKGFSQNAGIVPYIQMGLMSVAGIVVFLLARLYGSNLFFAYIVTFGVLARLMGLAYHFRLSEALSIPLFALTSYFLALWFMKRPNLWYLAMAGAGLGLLSLTRVVHYYFLPILVLAILIIPAANGRLSFPKLIKAAGVFTLLFALVIGPWMWRNATDHGKFSIGEGGTGSVYALRILYNTMTPKEVMVASIYWLPDFGDSLAKKLFPETANKFDLSHPDSFRKRRGTVKNEVQAQLEPGQSLTSGMQKALVQSALENPIGYIMSYVPLTIRGLRHLWLYVPFALVGLWYLRKDKLLLNIAGASILTIVTYAIHVAVTHFRARYGYPMMVGVAPLAAVGLSIIFTKAQMKWFARRQSLSQ